MSQTTTTLENERLKKRSERSRAQAPSEDDPLPEYHGPARVTLMVIDPYLVHVFWDLDPATPESQSAALRFHDMSGGSPAHFDVPVALQAKNWYVHLWNPNRSYCAELGTRGEDGAFTSLARSNTIHTPRAWPAAAMEPRIAPEAEESPRAANVSDTLPESAAIEPRRETVHPRTVEPIATRRESLPLQASEPAATPPRPAVPEPMDAGKILRKRLEEIYATKQWTARATAPRGSPAAVDPRVRPAAPGSPAPPDLTQLAEEHFATGISSEHPKPEDSKEGSG